MFDAIMRGKVRTKSVSELMKATGLSRKEVLTQAKILVNNHLVGQIRKGPETGYEKDSFLAQHRTRILLLAADPKKLARLPTKTSRAPSETVTIVVRSTAVRAKQLYIDDVATFSAVRRVNTQDQYVPMPEAEFKRGLLKILSEPGEFKDWGGETADVISSTLVVSKRRVSGVFLLKGSGTVRKKLTPAHLGKNGDQIQRMFSTSGDAFFVQYWSQIDEAVLRQLATFAQLKSVLENRLIYYGVIDGRDSARLIAAYPEAFPKRR